MSFYQLCYAKCEAGIVFDCVCVYVGVSVCQTVNVCICLSTQKTKKLMIRN